MSSIFFIGRKRSKGFELKKKIVNVDVKNDDVKREISILVE